MEFKKLIQYLNNLFTNTLKPIIEASWKRSDQRKDEIVKAIKDIPTEQTIKNTKDIVEPLLEAQKETTRAVKDIPVQVFPEVNFDSLEGKLEAVLSAIKSLKLDVNIGETKLEFEPVIKAIKNIKLEVPKMEKQEMIDYTLMLDEMMTILERPQDFTEIKKLQDLTKKLATTEDLTIIAQYLQQIIDKPNPEPVDFPRDKDGIPYFHPTKVGGGGGGGITSIQEGILEDIKTNTGGITTYEVVGVKNVSDVRINPATEETLQSIAGFNLPKYDNLSLGYTGSNLTSVIYKVGSNVVGTLTLGYDGSNNLISVVKS